MAYVPTTQDAIGAYFAAVADYYHVSVTEVNWPTLNRVKESAPGIFTIQIGGDVIIIMYDEQNDLFIVRLEDGTHVRVHKAGQGNDAVFTAE